VNLLRFGRPKPREAGSQMEVIKRIDEDLKTMITRGRFMGEKLSFGPNFVHAHIKRGDSGIFGPAGQVLDLGWSHNLKTTVGMDWLHYAMGGHLGFGVSGTIATATSATSLTATSTPFVASAYIGMIVVAEQSTNAPVWGNIGANTTSVLTVDAWYNGDDSAGTTPSSTANYLILPGQAAARYIALTTDTSGPAVGDVVLTSELTTNGLGRALATFAHTPGATTFTLAKTFSATGTQANIHKAGLFTAGTLTAAGVDVANTNLNADASVANGDSLAVTWTWTLPAAG
jgi:hypothetical protein